ncbi:MAG: type I glyceraldehyde-3-phosphate dehydrogenase [Desulfobacterales bacterium]
MTKVAINGLGRIGRATFKILLETPQLDLVAVNDLIDPDNLAYLLSYDSVYGRYPYTVEVGKDVLMVDGASYKFMSEKNPSDLPWKSMGVDLVFECTGVFRKGSELKKHLEAGAKWVILSAPEKEGDAPTVVHGVNQAESSASIVSCASCTTNCIAPVAEVMDRRIGVKKAAMTTIHAYTTSQSIVDGPRNKWRRGRAAAVNFVPTSTGAAKAAAKVLPQFKDKFDGVAVRGPVAVGSLADLVFVTNRDVSVDEINQIFKEEASGPRYENIMGVTEVPLVSSDIIRDPRASIVDLTMTQVVDGDLVKIMAWYDNEWGYSSQMVREAVRLTR